MTANVGPIGLVHGREGDAAPAAGVRPSPRSFYFGPEDRPLFGTVHAPSRAWTGARVLLCAPLGYEGLFAHITLGDLAAHLAETAGAVVMTFDYDGAGDSAGTDEDKDRVGRMLASIDHALDFLKAISDTPGPL